jgi:addiction module RelE/StbE family toxin
MIISAHPDFKKSYKKLTANLCIKVNTRINIFIEYQFDQILNNHKLKGIYESYRSINISGDLRAIYRNINEDEVIFIKLGTHS